MRLSYLLGTGEFLMNETSGSSDSGTDEAEQNQWNAMLGLCFHHARRQDFAAWRSCPQRACLRAMCCVDRASTRSYTCWTQGFLVPYHQERLQLLSARGRLCVHPTSCKARDETSDIGR